MICQEGHQFWECHVSTQRRGYASHRHGKRHGNWKRQIFFVKYNQIILLHHFIPHHLEQPLKWVVCHCCSTSAFIWTNKKLEGKFSIFLAIPTFFHSNFFLLLIISPKICKKQWVQNLRQKKHLCQQIFWVQKRILIIIFVKKIWLEKNCVPQTLEKNSF